MINELKKLIEKNTGKPVFDKDSDGYSFNNNSYLIHIRYVDTLRRRVVGFLQFSGQIEQIAKDLDGIPNLVLTENIQVMNNYFNDDKILSQDFIYTFDESLLQLSQYRATKIN